MIDFNVPPFTGKELEYMQQAIKNKKICGDGEFTKKCSHWMEEKFQANHVLLTTSCTHALEMAAVLTQVKPGMRSFFPPTPLSPQRMPSSSAEQPWFLWISVPTR